MVCAALSAMMLVTTSSPTAGAPAAPSASGHARLRPHGGSTDPSQANTWSTPFFVDPEVQAELTATSCIAEANNATFCAAVGGTNGVPLGPNKGLYQGTAAVFDGTLWSAPGDVDPYGILTSVSCVSSTFCMAVDDAGYALTYTGANTWSITQQPIDTAGGNPAVITSVSCVTTTFCMAVDATSTDPPNGDYLIYTGTWGAATQLSTGIGLDAVSCVSTTSCSAVDAGDSSSVQASLHVYAGSPSPTWTTQATTSSQLSAGLGFQSDSCASTTYCVAVDESGDNWTYDGSGQWTESSSPSGLRDMACAPATSSTLCVGYAGESVYIDYDGSFYLDGSWDSRSTASGGGIAGLAGGGFPLGDTAIFDGGTVVFSSSISCATTGICMLAARNNGVYAFSIAGNSWTASIAIDPHDVHAAAGYAPSTVSDVSCADQVECAATDTAGFAYLFDPSSPSWPSSSETEMSSSAFSSVSCATNGDCLAVDDAGDGYFFNGASWSQTNNSQPVDPNGFTSVSCDPGTALNCLAVDGAGDAYVYESGLWSQTGATTDANGFTSVACPSLTSTSTYCVATDVDGNALVYNGTWSSPTEIAAVSGGWDVSCPSTSFCMAIGPSTASGLDTEAFTTSDGTTWSAPIVIGGSGTTALSCSTASFCATFGPGTGTATWNGNKFTSLSDTDPDMGWSSGAISCPVAAPAGNCVAVDGGGHFIYGYPAGQQQPEGAITAAEQYGNGENPSRSCGCASSANSDGATTATSANRSEPVDTATGDLSESWHGFTISTVSQPLNLTLTYDAQLTQAELGSGATYGGLFGFGWNASDVVSLTTASSGATVYQGNGSQVSFTEPSSSSASCDASQSYYPRTVLGGSEYTYCAYPRITSDFGYFQAYGAYELAMQGGKAGTYSFSYTDQLTWAGDSHDANFIEWTYDVTPGTSDCPAATGGNSWLVECEIENDQIAGRPVVYGLGDISGYGLAVEAVWDSMGREYTMSYTNPNSGTNGPPAYTLQSAADPLSNTTAFAYSPSQATTDNVDDLTSRTDPNGNATTFTYDTTTPSRILTVTAPSASTDTAAQGSTWLSYEMGPSSGASYTTAFAYGTDAAGNPDTQVTYSNGDEVTDSYSNGLLIETQLGQGPSEQTWSYIHDPATLLVSSVTDPSGAVTSTNYVIDPMTGLLQSTTVTGPNGYVTESVFASSTVQNEDFVDPSAPPNAFDDLCWRGTSDSATNLPILPSCIPPSTTPDLAVTYYGYDPLGDLVVAVDPLGNQTSYIYDYDHDSTPSSPDSSIDDPDNDLVVESTYGNNYPAADAPFANEPIEAMVSNGSSVFSYEALSYDAQGDLTAATDGAGDTTTAAYNLDGQLESETAPDGYAYGNPGAYTTTYQYYGNGLLQSTTAPGSRVTSYTYDADGDLETTTNPAGHVTTQAYDQEGRLCWIYTLGFATPTCSTQPSGALVYAYLDATTDPAVVLDPNRNITSYAYPDSAYPDTPALVEDGSQNVMASILDSNGRVCAAGTISGGTSPYGTPGAPSSPSCGDTSTLSSVTQTSYDLIGNVTAVTDPSGFVTSYGYEHPIYSFLPTTTTTPQTTTDASYDADGNVILTENPNDPSDTTVSYGYTVGNTLCVKAMGQFTITGCAFPGGASGNSYTYDMAGRESGSAVYLAGTGTQSSVYSFDASSNVTAIQTAGPNASTVYYGYDTNNEVTCVTYPISPSQSCSTAPGQSNTIATIAYNPDGTVSSVSDWLGNTTSFNYSYPTSGSYSYQVQAKYPTSPTQSTLTLGYDPVGNLVGEDVAGTSVPTTTSWTPNANELIGAVQQNGGPQSSYSYDAQNRITAEGSDSFGYNPNGTISTATVSGSTSSFSYNADNELCAVGGSSPPGCSSTGVSFTYNQQGERIGVSAAGVQTTSYGWDAFGQLCWSANQAATSSQCSTMPSGATTYTYDASGLRSSETPSGGTAEPFIWDQVAGSIPRVIDDGTNAYIYGPDLFGSGTAPIEQINLSNSSVSYLISDPTGVREVTDTSGNVVSQMSYSAYGSPCSSCGAPVTPFGFEGSYTDPTGLLYLTNRYDDPGTAQFLSVDPMVAMTGQPYAFTSDNPANGADPLGLCGGGHSEWYDTFNPFSQNNPVYQWACNDPAGAEQVMKWNPAYIAINGYYNEAQAAEHGCSLLTQIYYGDQAVLGVDSLELTALGGGGLAGRLFGGAEGAIGSAAEGGASLEELAASGAELDPADAGGQLTRAGRAYAKASEVFGSTSGGPAAINEAGQNVLEEILTNPNSTIETMQGGRFAGGLKIVSPDGVGAVYSPGGTLEYFGQFPR